MHKFIHLISILASALLALIALAACNDAEGLIDNGSNVPVSDKPIAFTASDEWNTLTDTRGTSQSSFSKGDVIGVFAYLNNSTSPNFMNNQKVTFDGDNWTYEPVKYWPSNEEDGVDFYAYWPTSSTSSQIGTSITDDGKPNVTYDNINADIDWMVATCNGMNYKNGKDGVPLDFQHLLARVKFKFTVVGENEYHPVVHILKYNIPHFIGTTDFSRDTNGSFQSYQTCNDDSTQLSRYVAKAEGEIVNKQGTEISEFTAYMFPCSFPCTNHINELGSFTISLNNIEYKFKPSNFITVDAGKSYTINFNIKSTEESGSTNFFITSYTLWENGGNYEENLK